MMMMLIHILKKTNNKDHNGGMISMISELRFAIFQTNNYVLVSTAVSLYEMRNVNSNIHFFSLPGNVCVFLRNVQCKLQYTERWDKDRWIFFSITYSA